MYIIDVSQAVDLDHPHALDFLREDCVHVSVSYFPSEISLVLNVFLRILVIQEVGHLQDFFKKHGVAVMMYRELFDFIVDPTIADESVDDYLEQVPFVVNAVEICLEMGEISMITSVIFSGSTKDFG